MQNLLKKLDWQQRYEIGMVDIDVGHRQLVAELKSLIELLCTDLSVLDIKCKEFVGFAKAQSENEESILCERGCDNLTERKARHENMLNDINKYLANFINLSDESKKGHLIAICQSVITHMTEYHLDTEDGSVCIQGNSAV